MEADPVQAWSITKAMCWWALDGGIRGLVFSLRRRLGVRFVATWMYGWRVRVPMGGLENVTAPLVIRSTAQRIRRVADTYPVVGRQDSGCHWVAYDSSQPHDHGNLVGFTPVGTEHGGLR